MTGRIYVNLWNYNLVPIRIYFYKVMIFEYEMFDVISILLF